jgi:hypothetical protein
LLPLGHEVSEILSTVEVGRRHLYDALQRIKDLDKDGSDKAFLEFKQILKVLNDQVAKVSRNAKQYDREYIEATHGSTKSEDSSGI